MKNKIGIIILACVLVVSFVLGVTGAVTFAKDESTDNADGASKDRLIGVFITTEYLDLFDFEYAQMRNRAWNTFARIVE